MRWFPKGGACPRAGRRPDPGGDDAKLVWMRAEGKRWRHICTRFGIARATAHRRWEYGLTAILWRLEKRPLPKTWSRRYLAKRARAFSGVR